MKEISKMKEESKPHLQSKKNNSNFPKKHSITFTHLNPNTVHNFSLFLKNWFKEAEV